MKVVRKDVKVIQGCLEEDYLDALIFEVLLDSGVFGFHAILVLDGHSEIDYSYYVWDFIDGLLRAWPWS